MKYLTIGMMVLLGIACLSFGFGPHDPRGEIVFLGIGLGIVAMYLVAIAGRYQEQQDRKPKSRLPYLSALAFMLPCAAKALAFFIFAAVAIGVAVGLIGWGAIKLWSSWLTVEPRLQRAALTEPAVAIAASPPVSEVVGTVESHIVSTLPAYENVLVSIAPWMYVTRPIGARMEWSINLVDWFEWDEQPITATLPSAFWRVAR